MNRPSTSILAAQACSSKQAATPPPETALPTSLVEELDHLTAGGNAFALIRDLYPICRSITGNGLRQTLTRLGEEIPLEILEVPTGQPIFDWVIPNEWNINAAWIRDVTGKTLIDFADHNLHVVNYSEPVSRRMSWRELRAHVYTLPDQPDVIPYRTTYYERSWGFCMPDRMARQLDERPDHEYDVLIDATLQPGSLSIGECVIPGETDKEFLLSAHCCHPSLANDNLSGIAVAMELAKWLLTRARRYTYRFVFAPGTIGALAWLHARQEVWPRIRHGLVLSLLGDDHAPRYKRSRHHIAEIDEVAAYVTRTLFEHADVVPFTPLGYDERQYGSPGINLPVGRVCRSEYGTFPEYHTSNDNLQFVSREALSTSIGWLARIIDTIESNRTYVNRAPYGEPHLAKHLRALEGAASDAPSALSVSPQLDRAAVAWLMNFSDGEHSLLEIAKRSGMSFLALAQTAEQLLALNLLTEKGPDE